jgi:uracil permease
MRQIFKEAVSGAQILFVAFGAMVLVPLLTGLNPAMALLGAGIGTLLFQLVTQRQVPIFLGSSFAFIAPIQYSMATWGMPATLFGLFSAGFMYFIFALLIKWQGISLIRQLLPPVVIGPVIIVIGLSVSATACSMAMGKMGNTQVIALPMAIFLATVSLGTTVLTAIYGQGLFRLVPILLGATVGFMVATLCGEVDFSRIHAAGWWVVPTLILPKVNWAAAFFMLPVAIAPAIEHVGGVMAIGSVTGKDYTREPGLQRTLFGDGLGVCVAGLIGGPPVTTYAEVTGAVMITRNFKVIIMTWAAILAICLAFLGKFNALLQSLPLPVMGGIMLLLFGTIASIGLKTLIEAKVDLAHPRNIAIVSIVLTTGLGGFTVSAGDFNLNGVGLCSILAIVLNLLLPHPPKPA